MADKQVLIKPEKGETKEQFKARLKAALGVGNSGVAGGGDIQGETPEIDNS